MRYAKDLAKLLFLLTALNTWLMVGCAPPEQKQSTPASSTSDILIYGQVTGNTVNSRRLGMRYPNSVLKIASQLYVVDSGGHRILGYTATPGFSQNAPDWVLGQLDDSTDVQNATGVTASTLASPQAVATDGVKLYAVDRINHRVLIWNTIPVSTSAAANLVLGQPNLTTAVANNTPGNAGVPSAQSLYYPTSIAIQNGKLYVVDSFNHRILIWTTLPTSNQQAADIVIGQATMATRLSATTSKSMAYPNSIAVTSTQMIVADQSNNRVLIWNTLPSSSADNFKPADIVLGQANLSSGVANSGGISAQSMYSPGGVYSDGTRLFVSDTSNNRVLIWNTIPSNASTQQRAAADVVLGQPNMTSNTANNGGVSSQSLSSPYGLYSNGTVLIVADTFNHRILTWNAIPTSNQTAASTVLGQPDFTSNLAMNPGGITGADVSGPRQYVYIGSNKAIIADSNLNRILIWNSRPSGNYAAADVVLGQSGMSGYNANASGINGQSLSYPSGAYSDGTRLFVADRNNHRVLIWNSIPTLSNTAADVVLGQPNLTSNTAQNTPGAAGTASAQSLYFPNAVFSVGSKLYVSDTGNNRVLIWNTIPTSNQTAANVVVGQPDMASRSANNGGVSASSLSAPQGIWSNGTKLFICDFSNHRVLVFNTIPTTNFKAANIELGQSSMTTNTPNNGGIGTRTLSSPISVFGTANHLAVADYGNNRVLIWKNLPTANQKAANSVLGQANFTSNSPNYNGVSTTSLARPGGVWFDATRFIITDTGNDRVVDLDATTTLP